MPQAIQTTVELFAGIGGFRIAAERHGIQTLWANDICPRACQVYRSQFGDAEIRQGDIRAFVHEIPSHDLLTAGFPCQPFSSAGKMIKCQVYRSQFGDAEIRAVVRDPRGHLFAVIVDILRRHRPRYFILENVKRLLSMEQGDHFATMLAALTALDYQVEWRLINTMHFGLPQNRQRVLILGSLGMTDDCPVVRLASSEDLCRILERNFPIIRTVSSWTEIERHSKKFPNWGLAWNGRFFADNMEYFSEAKPIVPLRRVLQSTVDPIFDFTENTLQRLKDSKQTDKFVEGVQILYNQNGGARMGYTVFGIDGIAPTLTSTASRHYERYKVGNCYRRLTNVEYARIQGFPDQHCSAASIYNQYSLYGNAIPPIFGSWLIHKILRNHVTTLKEPKQQQLHLFLNESSNYAY